MTLARLILIIAGAGIAASLLVFGPNMITVFTAAAALVVAVIAIVIAPWLASRSGWEVASSAMALGMEGAAALVLLTSPPGNSHLWVPINIGRYGGFIVAGLGIALTLQAAASRRLDRRVAVALVSANVLAIVIGAAFAGWEYRG